MLRKLALAMLLVSIASNALAAATAATGPTLYNTTADVSAGLGIQGFNRSKNVEVVYASGTSGQSATPDVYAISTKHLQGDKIYGSTSASSYIWLKSSNAGTDLATGDNPALPATPSDSTVSNGFSQM